MAVTTLYITVCLCLSLWSTGTVFGLEGEYCAKETFHGECKIGEVLHIKSAEYGRMKVGKCIEKAMGKMDCSKDVLEVVGRACSGKQDCQYNVFSSELTETEPCGIGWPSYLKLEYECVPVLTSPSLRCETPPSVPAEAMEGYISSLVARRYGCGNMNRPWRFNVEPGQRVNITLISFNKTAEVRHTANRRCQALGYIVERGHRNNVTVCSKEGGTEHIYTSNGRHVDIYLKTTRRAESDPDFLLKYTVFGCQDVAVPPFSWYKREGDVTTIGCERNDNKWTLVCEKNKWKGSVGSCPDAAAALQSISSGEKFDLRMVTLISVGSGCVIFITLVAAVWVTKMRQKPRTRTPSTMLLQAQGQEFRSKGSNKNEGQAV